jgi:hypothetical protein
MDAKEFMIKFKSETDEERIIEGRRLFDIYLNDKEYTPVITKIINDIITSAGEGIHSQNEYFRIDAVGWETHYEDMKADAKNRGIKINAHLWDLKIAVEHENSKKDWSDELIKLIHIKCPLKVIIGYSHSDERGEIERSKLDFLSKWIQNVDAMKKGTDEQYLIILGNGCNHKTGLSDYTDFGYKGYIYNFETMKFEELVY